MCSNVYLFKLLSINSKLASSIVKKEYSNKKIFLQTAPLFSFTLSQITPFLLRYRIDAIYAIMWFYQYQAL